MICSGTPCLGRRQMSVVNNERTKLDSRGVEWKSKKVRLSFLRTISYLISNIRFVCTPACVLKR